MQTGELEGRVHHLPDGVDPNRPSAARIYDRFLGGSHNFAADRAVADRAVELIPELPRIMRANRAFLQRAVRFAAGRGIHQFLDLGSGIPTEGSVHEAARSVRPRARVVYVDREPTAVLHAREILGDDPDSLVLHGDLLDARTILDDPRVRSLLDFDQPVCLLMTAVLQFVPDSPALTAAVSRYRDTAVPGSLLAVSHATDSARPGVLDPIADLYGRTGTTLVLRDAARVGEFLGDWEPIEPGIVFCPAWHPDPGEDPGADPAAHTTLAAVAVSPGG
ncbi:SAM-dependent methyltransferase [Micromonosporaceae bacterium Da 78-11]